MRPELGPPDLEERTFPDEDRVVERPSGSTWPAAIAFGEPVLGGLEDAHYAWARVQDAYADSPVYVGLATALTT